MGRRRTDLSGAEARSVALAAQGLDRPRPTGRVDRRHLRRALGRMGVLQLDAVNVVARSQELVLFSRIGAHRRSLVADATAAGELVEYWAHEAAIVPVAQLPLFRWRMEQPFPWPSFRRRVAAMGGYLDEVLARVAAEGPLVASDVEPGANRGGWWEHGDAKTALAALFFQGRVTAWRRPRDFARVYDLPERVLPAEVLAAPTPSEQEARKELLLVAARGHGVATLKDLADYHHLTPTLSRGPLAELVEEGRLVPVTVDGWEEPAYLHPEARIPRHPVEARTLLSSFDPVIWTRPRAERAFGFHYRIEIYTPAAKRRYGYFVLPFLLGDRLVGRVDLKADRATSALRVQSAWAEPGVDAPTVARAMCDELREVAAWLGLDRVEVAERGDLAPALARAVHEVPGTS